MGGPFLVRCFSSLAGNCALFSRVHRRKSSLSFYRHDRTLSGKMKPTRYVRKSNERQFLLQTRCHHLNATPQSTWWKEAYESP